MSVIVIAHFSVPDMDKTMAVLAEHAALLDSVTEYAKGVGAIHHRFMAGDGELVVLDEWESPEQFQAFFEGNADVETITMAAGVTGPPRVEVYGAVEAAGTF